MLPIPAVLAFVLLLPLLYLPGLVIARALDRWPASELLERVYERVLMGALLNGWLAFTLAELGRFSLWLHVLLLVLLCGLLWLWSQRSASARPTISPSLNQHNVTSLDPGHSTLNIQGPGRFFGLDLPALILILILGLFLLLVARPFEVVLGVRDAGVYANTGFAIARTGGIVQYDAIVAGIERDQQSDDPALREAAAQAETNLLGVQLKQRNIATRLRAAGFLINEGDLLTGRVVPQGFHLFPVWIGLLSALGGMQFGLFATGLLGSLGLWSTAMLARRLAGPWAGVAAALLLAFNGPQLWFARYSTAEAIAQFLIFAGLYAFAGLMHHTLTPTDPQKLPEMGDSPPRRQGTIGDDGSTIGAFHPFPTASQINLTPDKHALAHSPQPLPIETAHSTFNIQHSTLSKTQNSKLKTQNSYQALLCGLAFGQLALARIDFVLVLAPLLLYLLYTWLTRRWQRAQSWLLAGLAAMLLHAAAHIALIARAYFFDTMFADLQLRALTSLAALPFLTPALRQVYLLRPCSTIAITPCPPVAGMPPQTEFLGWNIARISLEATLLLFGLLSVWALYRYGQGLMARIEAILQRLSRFLLPLAALGLALMLSYAYLIRPQIIDSATLLALPTCLSPAQMRTPTAACLGLQGYVGAPIAAPAYADPLAAMLEQLKLRLRGRSVPNRTACMALRSELLPAAANGRTSVELRRDGLASEAELGAERWAMLQSCDYLVLRDLIANSQANLVRVGWYLSPLGFVLGALGLVLLTLRMRWEAGSGSWLFLAVTLINLYFFGKLSYGTSDQHYIYILRRYVPVIYPALCVAMAYVLVRSQASGRRTQTLKTQNSAGHSTFNIQHSTFLALALILALTLFNIFTNQKIYTHTEYATALEQIDAIAEHFGPNDVLLLRGGAPGSARDIPDNLATPLSYAFGLNALTVKSDQPGKYAQQLARYVEQWQAEGRSVYMLLSASAALDLPGYALQSQGQAELKLREFEQPTNQKPSNIQDFSLGFQIYKLVPATERPALSKIAVDDYAQQVSGFYRAESDASTGSQIAWTNGSALLRIPRPAANQPFTVQLQLAAGQTRPAALGPVQACLDYRAELRPWADDPEAPPFSPQQCYTISAEPHSYALQIDPGSYAGLPGDSLLLRIQSATWLPARDDPQQHDRRVLGLQFLGAEISTVVQSP